MHLKEIEETIASVLAPLHIQLYEVKWQSNKTLQVCIVDENGGMDLDTCVMVSDALSNVLDEKIHHPYNLEVCSPGAEREITSLSEIIDKEVYVYVVLKHSIRKQNSFYGFITISGDEATLLYQDKAVKKTIQFSISEIEFIRYAVKI